MRIGILTVPKLTPFQQKVLTPILDDPEYDIRLVIIDDRPTPPLRKRIKKNIKKGRGGYVLVMAIQRYFSPPEKSVPTQDFFASPGTEFLRTRRLYSEPVVSALKKQNLDALLLLGGFGIIKEPVLNICPEGTLGYHHGDMRRYRGMPPAFWELYHGDREMGITIQRLAAGLDCGLPIVEKHIPIEPHDSLKSLKQRLFAESTDMMHEALNRIRLRKYPEPIASFGKIYTLPKLNKWLMLHLRVFSRKLRHAVFRKTPASGD